MPIVPSDWIGSESVNAVGLGGSSNPYAFCKTFSFISNNTTDFIELIGYCNESINREITVEIKNGIVDFYWKNKSNELFIVGTLPLLNQDRFIDNNLDCLGLTVKVLQECELFITLRWDKDVNFNIWLDDTPQSLVVTVNGDEVTFTNYQDTENFFISFDYNIFTESSNNYLVICPRRSFDGTYNLDYGGYYQFRKDVDILASNELIPITFDFSFLRPELNPDWDTVFRFDIGATNPEEGLRFSTTQALTVSYNSEIRIFTISEVL